MKKVFSIIASLAILMGIAFFVSSCKNQRQTTPTKITIKYLTEKGIAPKTKTVDSGYRLKAEDLPSISAEGFIFEGWHIGETMVPIGYTVYKDITLTAKWEVEKVTITYSTEHGTAPASETVDSGYRLKAEDLPTISAEGFIFEGWYIGETKVSVGYVVTKDISLTAKWKVEKVKKN